MTEIKNVLELLKSLISSTTDETIHANKVSLADIKNNLHDALEVVELLHESQVQ